MAGSAEGSWFENGMCGIFAPARGGTVRMTIKSTSTTQPAPVLDCRPIRPRRGLLASVGPEAMSEPLTSRQVIHYGLGAALAVPVALGTTASSDVETRSRTVNRGLSSMRGTCTMRGYGR
jgi:hypothetical protein